MTPENIFIWILNMSLTGSLMILAVLLMRLFLKRAPKIFSYMLWLIVLFRLLCPISFESEYSLLNVLGVSSVGNGTVDFISESIGTEGSSGVDGLFGNLNMSSESAGADDEIRAAMQEGNTYENNRYEYAGQGGTASEDGRRQGIQSETTNPNMIQQETESGETMQDEPGNSESMQPDAAGQTLAYEDADRQGNIQQETDRESLDTDNMESLGIWRILGLLHSSQIQSVFSVGSIVWLIGVAILMLYGFVSYVHLNRKLYRLESKEPVADDISALKNRTRIYRCNDIPTAFVLGFFRPRIYLPANLEETEERYILLHEQVHIKRGDSLYRTIAYLALCLHWFNPFVWLAFYLSGMDMEMSCDEAVIRQIGSGIKKEYSQTLLALATGSSMVKGIPLAFGEGDTGSRIKNVLSYKKPTVIIVSVVFVLCLTAAIFLLGNPLNNTTEDNGEVQVSGNDIAGETDLTENENNNGDVAGENSGTEAAAGSSSDIFVWPEYEEYFPFFEGEWVAVEYAGSVTVHLPPEEYTDEYYERIEAWENSIKDEFLGSEYRIELDNIRSFGAISELGIVIENDDALWNVTSYIPRGISLTAPYMGATVFLRDTDEYYNLIMDDNGTLLIEIMNNYFRLERKSETDFVADLENELESIFHFSGEDYFPLFVGRWEVSEYLCNTEYTEIIDRQEYEYTNRIIQRYLGSELTIKANNIDYFGPISNTNFELSDEMSLHLAAWISRDDIESLGLSSPYTGAKVHLIDRDQWFRFIIDADGNMIVKIDHCFFRLEKIYEAPQAGEIYYDKNIINFHDAFTVYWENFYDVPREITVGGYSDDFPTELQDILIYCNDDVFDERDHYYEEYMVDLEEITSANAGDIPYDEIIDGARDCGYSAIKNMPIYAVDIDGDGEDEYMVYTNNSINYGICIVKFLDGRWTGIGGNNPRYVDAQHIVLYYGDRYYLMSEDELICWNDEAEMPDSRSFWAGVDVVGFFAPCWNSITVYNKSLTDYTPYEMYSDPRYASNDYLENINWETLTLTDTEEITYDIGYWSYWNIGYSLIIGEGWERSYDGEEYLYVMPEASHGRTSRMRNDKILVVIRRTEEGAGEIVKIYYVAANYDIQLN